VNGNDWPSGCRIQNGQAPALKKIMNRFFDDHQQTREVGDSGGIGVGKADGTPINM
jgi:hypothetical protein